MPELDPRVVAMAKEWCRMINLDPDHVMRQSKQEPWTPGKPMTALLPRWFGYVPNMQRLLDAADQAKTAREIVQDAP
jgi:hypothetical protein